MSIKFCQKCQNIRHITEFGKAKDGLYSTCNVCKKEYRLLNKAKIKEWHKQDYQNNKQKSLVAKGFRKTKSITEFVGCNLNDFKKYLESQFQERMTWDNYGKWHVDHKVPLVTANTEEEIYKLNYYTNLQPLWAEDNLKKGGR